MVATQLVTYVGNNVDTVVIGLRSGASQLGIYNRAFHLVMNTANQLRAPITNVAVPVLSRLQGEGARYWDFVRVGQVGLGYTIVVVLAFVIGAAVPITALLLGPRWAEAAPVLSLLAVAAVFQTLNSASYWVYISKGITGPLFRYNLVSVAIKIACILIGSQWGMIGVAVGYAIAPALFVADLAVLDLAGDRRRADPDPRRGASRGCRSSPDGAPSRPTAPPPLTAQWGPWAQVPAAALATLAAYAAAAALPIVRRDLGELRTMLRLLRRERLEGRATIDRPAFAGSRGIHSPIHRGIRSPIHRDIRSRVHRDIRSRSRFMPIDRTYPIRNRRMNRSASALVGKSPWAAQNRARSCTLSGFSLASARRCHRECRGVAALGAFEHGSDVVRKRTRRPTRSDSRGA